MGKVKKYVSIVLFFAFLVLSILFIKTNKHKTISEYNSSELHQSISLNANEERTDYINENGDITIASDLGYSTKIITSLENRKIEKYYDPEGKQVKCNDGYYSIIREYNEERKCIISSYRDSDGLPTKNSLGYSTEKNEYDSYGLKKQVLFYDVYDNPICSTREGYGKRYEYDKNGRINKIIYLDENGNPMVAGNGYAITTRVYYSVDDPTPGEIKNEFYFDEYGNPISLFLGQYGILREYNEFGQNISVTFLDCTGNPMITTAGYTTIQRKYQGNNYTEKYYDINGNPYKLSDGQYGITVVDGEKKYINYDGKEFINIKVLLNTNPYFVIVASIFLVLISAYTNKLTNVLLMLFSCVIIAYFTLMFRDKAIIPKNWSPLYEIRQLFTWDNETYSNMIKNIWLFIPLGATVYQLFPREKALLIPIILSIIIEIIQWVTGLGWCELLDVFLNAMGGIMGYGLAKYIFKSKSTIIQNMNITGNNDDI